MTQLDPIVNLPSLYVTDLTIFNDATTPNTKMDVKAGAARDSNNIMDLVLSSDTVIDTGVVGLNGLDAGTLAASSWYYVHIIGDSSNKKPTGCIMSLSRTAPTLPFGYDSFRWIGVARTDGSVHFLLFHQTGSGSEKTLVWDNSIATDVTAGTSATLALVNCNAGVPPLTKVATVFDVSFTPATAADFASIAMVGTTATTALPSISSVVAAKAQKGQLKTITRLSSSVSKIQYINSAASGSTAINVSSFEYSL